MTHICRFKDHTNDPDPSLVLVNDDRIRVQFLYIRFIRIVNVGHYHWTVDGLQERDQPLNAVIELVISDSLARVIGAGLHNDRESEYELLTMASAGSKLRK